MQSLINYVNQHWRTFAKASLAFVLLSLFAQILYFRPYWGLMDDWGNVHVNIPKVHEVGYFTWGWQYGLKDISWGMFRPTYPMMTYLIYLPGFLWGPTATYLWNALISCLAVLLVAKALKKIMRISSTLILVIAATQPHLYDLFQHPSLQEKAIHMAGAALLFLVAGNLYSPLVFISVILVSILGAIIKASFLIYMAMAGVAILAVHGWPKSRTQWLMGLSILGAWIILFLFIYWVSRQGAYTRNNQSVAKILPNIMSGTGILYVFPVVLFVVVRKMKIFTELRWTVPLVGILGYLAIFLPWGIGGYVQTLAGPIYAALLASICLILFKRFGNSWILVFCGLAVLMGAYRPFSMFERLGDLGAIQVWAPQAYAQGVQSLFMPCEEGALTMDQRFLAESGVPIHVTQLPSLEALRSGDILLYDTAMCPLPGRLFKVPNCEEEDLFRGSWAKSYRIVRLKNCATPSVN